MKNIFLLLGAAFIVIGCAKSVDDLPAISETGENTFGAKVNGAVWAPRNFGIVPTGPILTARYAGFNSIRINANDFSKQPDETEFQIYLRDFKGTGTYQLNQNTAIYPNASSSYGYYVQRKFHPLNEWITGPASTGTVIVTKWDAATGILSGSFQFQAANTNNANDVITVTEGRFDVIVE